MPFALLVAAQTQSPLPQFRAGVDVFELEVSVLDRERQPIRGLKQADFSVFENGKLQPIVAFSEIEYPEYDGPLPDAIEQVAPDVTARRFADRRLFTIVMDDFGFPACETGGHPELLPTVKQIAKFIVDSLGPSDLASVILTRDTRYSPDFTNDHWKLVGSINEFKPPCPAEATWLTMVTRGHVGLMPALQDVVAALAKLPQHRKAMIYIGIPPAVAFGGGSISSDRAKSAMDDAHLNGISISSIDVLGLTVERRRGPDFLRTLAENTGGFAVVDTNDFTPGVHQIFVQHHSFYLLGYQLTGAQDGRLRRLDVQVNRPGAVVYSRSGRNAPGPPDMVKAAPLPYDEAVDRLVTGLAAIQNTRRLFTYAVARQGSIDVTAEIASDELGAGKWSRGAQVEARVTRASGGLVGMTSGRLEPGQRATQMHVPLRDAQGADIDLSQGPFHVSVHVASVSASLDDGADAVSDGAILGEPVAYRAGSGPRAPLRPVAEFRFLRTERIRIEWPVLKALDERSTRLLRRTAEPMSIVPVLTTNDAGGRAQLAAELSLAPLAPGDYVIEVIAHSGAEIERKLVAFRVVQ